VAGGIELLRYPTIIFPALKGEVAQQHWTFLVMDGHANKMRQFSLSREMARIYIALGLFVVAAIISLTAGFFLKESQRLRAKRLMAQNALLEGEVETMRGRLTLLETSLNELSSKDEHYRLLAGLEPIDGEVQQVGIGGPGTATLQSSELYQLDPEQGRLAFSTSYDLNGMIRRTRLLALSWTEAIDSLTAQHDRWESTPSIMPTFGYISSSFTRNRLHPILDRARPHTGLDIAAPHGTPILAAAKGRVTFAGTRGDYGRMVEIDHGHGYVTRYAHASRLLVRVGQTVMRGDKIAEVGSTGLSAGPHLHYEVHVNGRAVNPNNFVFDGGTVAD
jgi:murein DD-endopeptidase MepM/ murein hydrolase activator NlpD